MDIPESFLLLLLMFICIFINAFFAHIEVAVAESSPGMIDRLIDNGNKKAISAKKILDEPAKIISILQMSATIINILLGAIIGAFLAPLVASFLPSVPEKWRELTALLISIPIVAYFSLLLGELLPKKFAFQNPEKSLIRYAPLLLHFETFNSPFVSFLSASANGILILFGYNPHLADKVTEDEVKDLIEQGTEDGTFEKTEQDMIGHIFHMSDQTAYSLMTPRTQMQWLDLEDSDEQNLQLIRENPETVFPVGRSNLDDFCGVIYAKELLNAAIDNRDLTLENFIKKPLLIPRSMETFRVLEKFRESSVHEAVVLDEYGGVVGFITLDDIMEEIIGENINANEDEPCHIIQRNENAWYIDGLCPIDDFKEMFNFSELPDEEIDHYQTVGGFLISCFGYIPKLHETYSYKRLTMEVICMDRARIDKILVTQKMKHL